MNIKNTDFGFLSYKSQHLKPKIPKFNPLIENSYIVAFILVRDALSYWSLGFVLACSTLKAAHRGPLYKTSYDLS